MEFQMRGSPHLHALMWTEDCPKLTSQTEEVNTIQCMLKLYAYRVA